jgi:hypothetical protein
MVLELWDHRVAIRSDDLLEARGSGGETLPKAAPLDQRGHSIAMSLGPKVGEM